MQIGQHLRRLCSPPRSVLKERRKSAWCSLLSSRVFLIGHERSDAGHQHLQGREGLRSRAHPRVSAAPLLPRRGRRRDHQPRQGMAPAYASPTFFLPMLCGLLFSLRSWCFSGQFELENLRKDFNRINKEVARLKIVSFFGVGLIILMF